ncbi:hypothetical protein EMCRGX_G017606 [Ephydatia muelleri]
MAHDSIVLSEVSVENFEHAWKRFQLAATAKQWQEEKQLQILPTLLRGNLVDYYMDLSEEENESLEGLKQALERKAGIKKDPSAEEVPVHAVHSKDSGAEIEQLKMMLERMSQRFETFEQQLKGLDTGMATKGEDNMKRKVRSPSGRQYRGNCKNNTRGCFLCGEEGHWKRECPLNSSKSAPAVDGAGL